MRPVRLLPLASCLLAASSVLWIKAKAADTTLISDGFSAAEHPAASLTGVPPAGTFLSADSNGLTGGAVTVNTTNNTLRLTDGDTNQGSTTLAIALLSSTALLTTTGDTISLGFTFKFVNTINSSSTIRFGLYNSNATAASPGSGSDNDSGYYVSLATAGSATNTLFFRESGTDQGMMGSATDRTALTASSASPALAFNVVYTVGLTLTRTASGINFSLGLSGSGITTTTITTSTTSSLYTAFDELSFSTAFNNSTTASTLDIDDVTLTASNVAPIPEPSSALLAGCGLLALGASRRRNRRK